ncbi:hypothetical protein SERN_2074 [Serinibacter arcticus]|uniref:Uncharacterized protein n=1 Tax=Serinibacter arcticus TaxID=1655435 RepID=A0A4Z1E4C0_9MICO|nr:hypothetical protein SERN_2074 [Serinibacter arcticus]
MSTCGITAPRRQPRPPAARRRTRRTATRRRPLPSDPSCGVTTPVIVW